VRLLLDTHALIWALEDNPALSGHVKSLISDEAEAVSVSIVSVWEIAIKNRAGKLSLNVAGVLDAVSASGYALLAIEPRHMLSVMTLPPVAGHRDPFDHLLIARAITEDMTFVSNDRHVPFYAVQHIRCDNET
jgi:PIN domain nuclease of toxin-antitoxin system